MTIKPLTPNDYSAYYLLLVQLAGIHDMPDVIALHNNIKQHGGKVNVFVATRNQVVVATGAISIFPDLGYIHEVVVNNNHRNQNIGTKLVQFLCKQTPKRILLSCSPTLVNFYQHLGFAPKRLNPNHHVVMEKTKTPTKRPEITRKDNEP